MTMATAVAMMTVRFSTDVRMLLSLNALIGEALFDVQNHVLKIISRLHVSRFAFRDKSNDSTHGWCLVVSLRFEGH